MARPANWERTRPSRIKRRAKKRRVSRRFPLSFLHQSNGHHSIELDAARQRLGAREEWLACQLSCTPPYSVKLCRSACLFLGARLAASKD
jgi:hypothetical protein